MLDFEGEPVRGPFAKLHVVAKAGIVCFYTIIAVFGAFMPAALTVWVVCEIATKGLAPGDAGFLPFAVFIILGMFGIGGFMMALFTDWVTSSRFGIGAARRFVAAFIGASMLLTLAAYLIGKADVVMASSLILALGLALPGALLTSIGQWLGARGS